MVGCSEAGGPVSTLFVTAQLAHGMGMILAEFVAALEDRPWATVE